MQLGKHVLEGLAVKPSLTFTVLVLFLLASNAEGDPLPPNFVWFEAAPVTATSSVATQGALGGDLVLQCDTSAGPTKCEWNITMRMNSSIQFGSMGTDLLGDTDEYSVSAIRPGNFPSDATNHQDVNAGGKLASFKEVNIPLFDGPDGPEYDPTDGAPDDYILLAFTLATNKAFGETTVDGIDAQINELLWVGVVESGPTPDSLVQFGEAVPLDGTVSGGIAESAIIIQSIPESLRTPEPAVCMLLVLGCLILPRRRHQPGNRAASRGSQALGIGPVADLS